MRLFSEMIIFIVVCLVIVSVIYGVQDAFIPDGTPAGIRWQSRAHVLAPIHSWGFGDDTELPSAPGKAAGPIVAPAQIPPPAGPGAEDLMDDGDAFFDAKFRNL